jgi:hypothetical protein
MNFFGALFGAHTSGENNWQQLQQEAQNETTLEINGQRYARLPYGEQDFCAPDGTSFGTPGDPIPAQCHDCEVPVGQYHVQGCDVERCPRCRRQAIACGCQQHAR